MRSLNRLEQLLGCFTRLHTPPSLISRPRTAQSGHHLLARHASTRPPSLTTPLRVANHSQRHPLTRLQSPFAHATPHRTTTRPSMTAPAQQHARAAVHLLRRSFHPSRRRQDIFFVSIPAFKSALLAVIRASLIFLPLAWRWGAFRRFPKFAGRLWQLPLLAICLVVGLGLNQSPKTARWRLLLMSEREELEWSQQR